MKLKLFSVRFQHGDACTSSDLLELQVVKHSYFEVQSRTE